MPSQPGPDCPMTVDAERLEGKIVQVGAGGVSWKIPVGWKDMVKQE